MSGSQLRAKTIENLLRTGCGLSHKHVDYGCKGTCVKFRDWKPEMIGDVVSLMYPLTHLSDNGFNAYGSPLNGAHSLKSASKLVVL